MSRVKVNPYRLFQLPEPGTGTFTKDELKNKMRKLILITHPDKPTGSEKKFNIVMECYKFLSEKLREAEKTTRQVDKKAIEETRILRESEMVEIPSNNFTRFSKGSGESFNSKAFNQFFEENQLDNPMDRGHGDWLKQDDPDVIVRSKEKIGKGRFQEAFEEERRRLIAEKRLVQHRGIQAMQSNLGTSLDDVEAYSGVVKMKTGGIMGVDVREAHEMGIIAVDDSRYQNVSGKVSMEEARLRREGARLEYTREELEKKREQEEYEKRQMEERQRRIRDKNRQIEEQYRRVNYLLNN